MVEVTSYLDGNQGDVFVFNEAGAPKEHDIRWAVDQPEIREVIASLVLVSDMITQSRIPG